MNSNSTDIGPSEKTPTLPAFRVRLSAYPGEVAESPTGGDLKPNDNGIHPSAGHRTTPNLPQSSALAGIPRPVGLEPAFRGSEPAGDLLTPHSHPVARIPAWLLAETAVAFKVGLIVIFLLAALGAFKFGEHRGRHVALREVKAAPVAVPALPPAEFPEELLPTLDSALRLLRGGDNLDALGALNKMLASHTNVPSLHFATAIAALQAGYPREADRLADASIKAGFRVSDSWALKSAILASQTRGASAEQETLLKKAIACDPMNPAPLIELASLLRHQGKTEAAVGLLESASFRLNPAEAQTVIETTKAILALDVAGNLAPAAQPLGIPEKDIPNAFSEMKRGNFDNAAAILRFCRDQTAPDLFGYLVNDPALRKFTSRPELKEFY